MCCTATILHSGGIHYVISYTMLVQNIVYTFRVRYGWGTHKNELLRRDSENDQIQALLLRISVDSSSHIIFGRLCFVSSPIVVLAPKA
jgi:hypothetical protein